MVWMWYSDVWHTLDSVRNKIIKLDTFLPGLSWKLKWAFLIAWYQSFVRLSINFPHSHLVLHYHSTDFNQTWHKTFKFVQIRPRPFPRGDNYEIAEIHWRILKIFFSRTLRPISTKLGTKHPLIKGIKVCSNGWVMVVKGKINTK